MSFMLPFLHTKHYFFVLMIVMFSENTNIILIFIYSKKDIAKDVDKAVCLIEELRIKTCKTQTFIHTLGPGSAPTPFLML